MVDTGIHDTDSRGCELANHGPGTCRDVAPSKKILARSGVQRAEQCAGMVACPPARRPPPRPRPSAGGSRLIREDFDSSDRRARTFHSSRHEHARAAEGLRLAALCSRRFCHRDWHHQVRRLWAVVNALTVRTSVRRSDGIRECSSGPVSRFGKNTRAMGRGSTGDNSAELHHHTGKRLRDA